MPVTKLVPVNSLLPGAKCKLPDDPEFPPPYVWEVLRVSPSSVRVRELVKRERTFVDSNTNEQVAFTQPARPFNIAGSTLVIAVYD